MLTLNECLIPDWPASANVRALSTMRGGGCSTGPYGLGPGAQQAPPQAGGLNLGEHVGDDPERVARNRARLRALLPAEPCWLNQVHGTHVVRAQAQCDGASGPVLRPDADGCVAFAPEAVCAVMTADCLPLLLCDRQGLAVGAAHAGWRGLCAGVIEQTVSAMRAGLAELANERVAGRGARDETALMAWLGPAIGPAAFEVGAEVRAAFLAAARDDEARATADAFVPVRGTAGKYLASIAALARIRLARVGVNEVHGGEHCTSSDPGRFYSYRRDGVTGRQATLIWLAD